jgi:hypothetical protein
MNLLVYVNSVVSTVKEVNSVVVSMKERIYIMICMKWKMYINTKNIRICNDIDRVECFHSC